MHKVFVLSVFSLLSGVACATSGNDESIVYSGTYYKSPSWPAEQGVVIRINGPVPTLQKTEQFDHALPDEVRFVVVSKSKDNLTVKVWVPLPASLQERAQCRDYLVSVSGRESLIRGCQDVFDGVFWEANKELTVTKAYTEMLNQVFVPPVREPTPEERYEARKWEGFESPAAFGYTRNESTLTHYEDHFALYQERPYQDIVYVEHSMKAYTRPGNEPVVFPEKQVLAVKEEEGEGFLVDQFNDKAEMTSFWVSREDLANIQWVSQEARLPQYEFLLGFAADDLKDVPEGEYREEGVYPLALRVKDRHTGKIIQTLYDIESETRNEPSQVVSLVDANFDGHLDVVLPMQSGGAGPNYTNNVFLFNPKNQRFEWNEEISMLPQLSIDSKNKLIESGQRNGCCEHSMTKYRWRNGRLLVVYEWQETLRETIEETTVGRLVKGKMRYTTHTRRVRD